MTELTERQLKAIPHLVAAPTYTEGAEKAQISRKTLYEWLKNPEFREELDYQRDEVTRQTLDELEQGMTKAVNTLVGLLDTEDQRLKRLVCNDIIEHVLKHRVILDFEQRLDWIEDKLSEKK
jgi:phage terminase small subunit